MQVHLIIIKPCTNLFEKCRRRFHETGVYVNQIAIFRQNILSLEFTETLQAVSPNHDKDVCQFLGKTIERFSSNG